MYYIMVVMDKGKLIEKMDVSDSRYLAILTSECNSRKITYIVKSTKMQKRQTLLKGFALLKNDITGSELNV
mgnify:CR=1 FL=1